MENRETGEADSARRVLWVTQGQCCSFRWWWRPNQLEKKKSHKIWGAGSELEGAWWQAQPPSCQLQQQLKPCLGPVLGGSEVKVPSGDRRENSEQAAHREELFCRGAGCPPSHPSLRTSMEASALLKSPPSSQLKQLPFKTSLHSSHRSLNPHWPSSPASRTERLASFPLSS